MDTKGRTDCDADPGAGRLEGRDIPELLWWLQSAGRTGCLRVTPDGGWPRRVYLDAGRVVSCASEDPDDRLGARLVVGGLLRASDLTRVLERQASLRGERRRMGELLVDEGVLTPERRDQAVVDQQRRILLELFPVERGGYRFHSQGQPQQQVEPLGPDLQPEQVILDGVRRITSPGRLRRSVGGLATRYARAQELSVAADELADQLLQCLAQGPRNVESLCDEMLVSSFETLQLLWGLRTIGAIFRVAPGRDLAAATTGSDSALAGGLLELLTLLHEARETGVLQATSAGVDRCFYLREGDCVFATSSDRDDGLLAHLLRRGVISLREAEEARQRLLTNRRVGEILLELGLLEPIELTERIREQLLGLVCDTCAWTEAEYRFVSGSLPSVETIPLNLSFASLVREIARRTDCWSRVLEGCGGLDATWSLAPGYLDVLDAMRGDVEEWELAVAFREPRSVREVLAQTRLPDLRAAQILWSLRALGALIACDAEREGARSAGRVSSRAPARADATDTAFAQEDLAGRPPVAAGPGAGPPANGEGLDTHIARFNEHQRLVYRLVRAEVGAGAANLIRACCVSEAGWPAVLADSRLEADGGWEVEGLRAALVREGIEDPSAAYRHLIHHELERLGQHIATRRLDELRQQLGGLDREDNPARREERTESG